MYKVLFFLIISTLSSTCFSQEIKKHPLDNMPIMGSLSPELRGYSPLEQRGLEYKKFLSPSVKIEVNGASGSGTIVYYDRTKNLAYVASCGHLWNNGVMSAEEGKIKNMKCKVKVFYKNDEKLSEVETYKANVIFYSYTQEVDTSLVTFSPDWEPSYFVIAPINYNYKINSIAHSCGCDGGSEVAHYSVKIKEINEDLITSNNSPRPGRSGGGLMDDSGYYIGTCWGTEHIDGSGLGFFTPIKDIHNFWSKQKGYEFILNQSPKKILAKIIPIKDKNSTQGKYSIDYILAP